MSQEQAVTYGFDQETPEQLGTSPIPAGIRENIKLVDVVYEPAKEDSDNMCLAFYFEDEEGRQLRHVEWPIDAAETRKRAVERGDDPSKALQKRVRAQGVRIKHIVTKVIPKENAVVQANSFEQYANGVVNLVKQYLPAGPFRLKVLLNNRNYSTLPPYTPFIEDQEEKPETDLSIGSNEKVKSSKKGSGGLEMPDEGGESFDDDEAPF